jgi:fatty-acyl-CoA synthase
MVEAAVVAVPHPRWEERPLAIVVWNGDHEPDFAALRTALRSRMAKFMVPDHWAVRPALPKTSVGKIDKKRLREQVAAGHIDIVHETKFAAEENADETRCYR